MKHVTYISLMLIGAALEFFALLPKPSSAPVQIPTVGESSADQMTPAPDHSNAGNAAEEIADLESAATATGQEDRTPGTSAVVSLTLQPPTIQEQMLAENNRIRAQFGKPPQVLDNRLSAAAQQHADYMARTGRLEHSGSNGTPQSRATAAGFPGIVNENAAGWFSTPEWAFRGWQASHGHRETMLSDQYDSVGFGRAVDAKGEPSRWVALYGNSRQAPVASSSPVQVYQPAAVYYQSYNSCGAGGCSSGGIFRGGLFGRRR